MDRNVAGWTLLRARSRRFGERPHGRAALTTRRAAHSSVVAAIAVMLIAPLSARAEAPRLAGLLDCTPEMERSWPRAGAFLFPVGDAHDFRLPDRDGAAGYAVLRGVSRGGSAGVHQGADLGDGSGGGSVRAAAAGIVVRGAGDDWQDGYGWYVTLAHRLPDGTIVYTVYAHLEKGSVCVSSGECVAAGQRLGRVGRSGRATTEHLHFEVRLPDDPGERWEKTSVADPIQFVRAHLPAHAADSSWAARYLEWAELAGLIGPTESGDAHLKCARWWNLLANITSCARPAAGIEVEAAAHESPEVASGRLVDCGVIEARAASHERPGALVTRDEFRRDLARLVALPVNVPEGRATETQAQDCERHLGGRPTAAGTESASTPHETLTIAMACLALADVCGGPEPAGAPPQPKPASPSSR
jgi:Peptidase family M23